MSMCSENHLKKIRAPSKEEPWSQDSFLEDVDETRLWTMWTTRNVFGDLETWIVWGNIALSHQYHLAKAAEKNLISSPITIKSYYSNVAEVKIHRGINASSIADISRIPRATVIRKLKWLIKQNCIKKNRNLEYQMKKGGYLNKKIEQNFLLNQHSVAEFLTDIFDLMKNSEFKI